MSVHIAADPKDGKAVELAAKGEPEAKHVVRIPFRRGGLMLVVIGITLMTVLPLMNMLVPSPSKSDPLSQIEPKMELANAARPFVHFLVDFGGGLGILAILIGGGGVFLSLFAQSITGPALADQRDRNQFLKLVDSGRLKEVHPEIIAGATRWARDNDFQLITGSATDVSLAHNIHETEADDRRAALEELIERHIAVLAKAQATGIITKAELASLDSVTELFERLSRISLGDQGPRHVQEIMALYPAMIKMVAPVVELLGMDEVSVADKAEIRRGLRDLGAWIAKTEKELMDEHPTDEAIRTELAHDLVTQVRALTPVAE